MELAEKMMKRDAATAPTVGDRVAYVIVKARACKSSKLACPSLPGLPACLSH